jgi:hypothetical protein
LASGEALTRSPAARGGATGALGAAGVSTGAGAGGAFGVASALGGAGALGAMGGVGGGVSGLGADRDRCADLHAFTALRDQDLRDRALVDRFELHRRLVGLDLGEDVAGLHLVAFLDQPFGERALLHGRRKRGHLEFNRHEGLS